MPWEFLKNLLPKIRVIPMFLKMINLNDHVKEFDSLVGMDWKFFSENIHLNIDIVRKYIDKWNWVEKRKL